VGGVHRRLGEIARTIHAVRGDRFGPVAGPAFATWSEAVVASLADTAADLDDAGLDSTDVREVAAIAIRQRAVLDEITEPRLLNGDLWTVNVMIAPDAPEPTITGVLDCDRTSWGDPESDWPIFMAGKRPGTERDAFWEAYGTLATTPGAARRSLFYRARHIGAARLERHRPGHAGDVPDTYRELREVLAWRGTSSALPPRVPPVELVTGPEVPYPYPVVEPAGHDNRGGGPRSPTTPT
jgi:aminoglycoside phosphotransferase (APT) family kinase protein